MYARFAAPICPLARMSHNQTKTKTTTKDKRNCCSLGDCEESTPTETNSVLDDYTEVDRARPLAGPIV
jgi:hypothetical protein